MVMVEFGYPRRATDKNQMNVDEKVAIFCRFCCVRTDAKFKRRLGHLASAGRQFKDT